MNRNDPADFAETCSMFQIELGARRFSVDVRAFDEWVSAQGFPVETLAEIEKCRVKAVAAYSANDWQALSDGLNDWCRLIDYVRVKPMAHKWAKQTNSNKTNSKKPRPNRKDPLREKVKTVFHRERAQHPDLSLKDMLHNWGARTKGGLSLTYDPQADHYILDDENETEMQTKVFTYRQMKTLWSKSVATLPG